jgi:hypothetical protein
MSAPGSPQIRLHLIVQGCSFSKLGEQVSDLMSVFRRCECVVETRQKCGIDKKSGESEVGESVV